MMATTRTTSNGACGPTRRARARATAHTCAQSRALRGRARRRKIKLKGHKQRGKLEVGEKVDARHADSTQVLPAEVVEAHSGNLYSVKFDDGETQKIKRE